MRNRHRFGVFGFHNAVRSGGFFLVLALFVLCMAGSSFAACDAIINVTVNGDEGTCGYNSAAFWEDGENGEVFPGSNWKVEFTVPDYVFWCGTRGGRFYIKDQCESGGYNYKIQSASGTGWISTTLLGYSPSDSGNSKGSRGYWKSYHIEAQDSTETTTLTYKKRAKYTVSYNFDVDKAPYSDPASGWTNTGTTINLSAPNQAGYICTGYSGGSGSVSPASSNSCSVSFTLNSNSAIAWEYKQAHYLTTAVSGGPTAAQALVSPYTNDSANFRIDGNVTVEAKKTVSSGNSRYNLTGFNASGSLSSDTSYCSSVPDNANCSKTFDLQADTVVTWLYNLQHKVAVSVDSTAPAGVREAANPSPPVGDVWTNNGNFMNFSTAASVTDPNTGNIWNCAGFSGTGNIPASGSSCSLSNVQITQPSTITWLYGRVHNMYVGVEGVDDPAAISGLSPPPGDNWYALNTSLTVSASTELYNSDRSVRYVLERYVGTGKVPLSGDTNVIGPITLDQNSSIRWIYRKEVRFKVGFVNITDNASVDAMECNSGDTQYCVENANRQPRPNWVVPSTDTEPYNYYPVNTQVTATAKYLVSDSGTEKTCMGVDLVSGVLSDSSGAQLIGSRRAVAFTIKAPVEIKWNYQQSERYEIGAEMLRPAGANDQKPLIEIVQGAEGTTADNAYFWAPFEKKLYPVRPVTSVRLTWYDMSNQPTIVKVGYSTWPPNRQAHIAGAPANLQPPSGADTFVEVRYSENAATSANSVFEAGSSGKSVLLFVEGTGTIYTKPVKFTVVDTFSWETAPYTVFGGACEVGKTLTDASHRDPEGKEGFVFYEKAYYDGYGSKKAYDRPTRTGPIIPVNETLVSEIDRRMVVVWYETSAAAIGWPVKPVQYDCKWPSNPAEIVIASGQGWKSSVQNAFPQGYIYYQSDRTKAGYNPNEEHAILDGDTVYALRNDLNYWGGTDPYVLLKYKNASGKWEMKVFKVTKENGQYDFTVNDFVAGNKIMPFPPLAKFPSSERSRMKIGADWYYKDLKGGHWAKAADSNGTSEIVMNWYYPLQEGFYYPDFDGNGAPDSSVGGSVPFLGHDGGGAVLPVPPQDVTYKIIWPSNPPVLGLGETLIRGKNGLPDLANMAAAKVIFDQSLYGGGGHLAKLIDPLSERTVALGSVPADIKTESRDGKTFFLDLPYYIQSRLFYDPTTKALVFKGILDETGVGDPLLLLNVITQSEKDIALGILPGLSAEIVNLYEKTRNPNGLSFEGYTNLLNPYNPAFTHTPTQWLDDVWGLSLGLLQDASGNPVPRTLKGVAMALTAGVASGTGFVTLVENDDESLGSAPVALHVLKVGEPVYGGVIKIIKPVNVFDEKLTLRHNADFAGEPERFTLEWYFKEDTTGFAPPLPVGNDKTGWTYYGRGPGLSEITLESEMTLTDKWFVVRYYYRDVFPAPPSVQNAIAAPEDDPDNWSPWAGAPGGQSAQLAEGWLKRVANDLNPLDARVRDFERNETNTLVSMISQAGRWCGGVIALNSSPENLNSVGLIEAYQTLLNRAVMMSVDAGYRSGPANNSLLYMATRLSDLYMLLGNEAYADAVDPTIGFDVTSTQFGSLAPSIFAFQNQLDSLLEEELILLRGRDDTAATTRACPVYNRLFWNFTNAEGEVAYRQTYNVKDGDRNGVINEEDAKLMFPQGHGDAWGQYLSSMKNWYRLLSHGNFSWEPRAESVIVGGTPVLVDYLDERKFAKAAAQKAKTGSEIVDLTYRSMYVDDPAGQWQGYKDTDSGRAWGVDDWARRAGQGAYFDWLLANAMLPATDENPAHSGITKIDRTTVTELETIAGEFNKIQSQMDKADTGLNPLGLAKGVVPFDIDPAEISKGKTHFEQIYERALKAVGNSVSVFNFANQFTQSLRRSEDTLDKFRRNIDEQERDYRNRLIEIFGYPYGDDIGSGKTYPAGYDGPDWVHYMYVDRSELTGETPSESVKSYSVTFNFDSTQMDSSLGITASSMTFDYHVASDRPWLTKPPSWSGTRRATGEAQMALSEFMRADAAYQRALKEFDIMIGDIDEAKLLLETKYNVASESIRIMNETTGSIESVNERILSENANALGFRRAAESSDMIFEAIIEGIPKVAGIAAADVCAPARAALYGVRAVANIALNIRADVAEQAKLSEELSKDAIERNGDLKTYIEDSRFEVQQLALELDDAIDAATVKQYELYTLKEEMNQALGRFHAVVAEGERLLAERAVMRTNASADVQDYRYKDISFRIFRNDALQKYRAQFDLAARYVYLAATAYDYETNLLGSDTGAGRKFLSNVFKQRTIGQLINGVPVAGQSGLADVLAKLSQNFDVYKSQLGFNNPQTETNRFSLRSELFRLRSGSIDEWKGEMKKHMVSNLWNIPEFKRYCRPFTTESMGAQPGIVIPFSTGVTFGKNFFGWPLSGGDSAYDPTNFATKVRSVGVWFTGYNTATLSNTPRVYLVPVGADVLRSPSAGDFATREWKVVDQKLPAPFSIGSSDLSNKGWIPMNDSLSDSLEGIRRFSSFRAYRDSDYFTSSETTSDSRLIGRSVWNTQWMLIIPGGTLLYDPSAGLEEFINSVTDIKLFFQTYAYSGN